ncbi:MAG: pirin family protein [Planctomycetota bacterium]|jgi:redox-sensitive bicupin YhaK (pirin superfamily)
MTLRRNTERHYSQSGKRKTWRTFDGSSGPGLRADSFGLLVGFDEVRLAPGGASGPQPGEESELLTYLYRGELAQEDSTGSSGVMRAGEFQRMTGGVGIRRKETNASRTNGSHAFRISLRPSEAGLECAHEHKRFPAAQRHNVLCAVGSSDGRRGSLRLLQDALVYSSVLDSGYHLIHELLPGRSAWLHIVCGEVSSHDVNLAQGDGVGVTTSPSVSFTALDDAEVLLVDVGPAPRPFA